jgi:hypothetical protein
MSSLKKVQPAGENSVNVLLTEHRSDSERLVHSDGIAPAT